MTPEQAACLTRHGAKSLLGAYLGSEAAADAWRAARKRRHYIHWTPPAVWGEEPQHDDAPDVMLPVRSCAAEAKDGLGDSKAALVLRQCREAGIILWIEGRWLRSRGWTSGTRALYARFKLLRNDVAAIIKAKRSQA